MREIPLANGNVALVDDEDFSSLSAFDWFAAPNKSGNWYAKRISKGANGKPLNIYMHREILQLGKGEVADHKDRNGLNNQRSNLRRCSYSLNSANTLYPTPRSGFRGVYCHRKRFRAQGCYNDKTVNLGYFDNPVDAARARDAYVFALYGEFAVLNFPKVPA